MSRRGAPPGEPRLVGYLYIAPALIVFALFFLVPLGHGVWLSFFEWDGLSLGRWVGGANYVAVLTEPELRAPFLHACVLIIFFSLLPVTFGVALAAALHRTRPRGRSVLQAVIFLPQVIALTVVAVAWREILAPDGPLSTVLRAVGLPTPPGGWLGNEQWALPSIGLVGVWLGTGLCVVLFLSGLAKIPAERYEAARLDGAGPVAEFFAVSLPSLRGELAVALTLTIIAALRTFDLVYLMTGGGPARASAVPAFEVYDRAMQKGEVGTGVTIALLLTVVILAVTVIVNRLVDDRSGS